MTTIVPGSTSQALAAQLARELSASLTVPTYDRFPDGETLAAVPSLDDENVIIVASTTSNDAHIELLQLGDAVREAGTTDVTVVIPYMGYARQDQAFNPGQPISARAAARAVSTAADRIVLVNPHEGSVADFFTVPVEIVDAAGQLATPLPETLDQPLFLSPDAGAIELAETTQASYGRGDVDYFEKERDYDTGEIEITPSDASVSGRDVVVVDDIIATGSTMSEAVSVLTDRGANSIYVTCVHPMLVGNALTKLSAAGITRVFGTDTIERPVSDISVAPTIAAVLDN
ncbi:ribose-phosphate diphosphokinase [Natronocalculus amylovorans]|uniref:Ribose-phosphate pyrophosphokinase n=1 Tax=Natronocalculus amylovorans TaxID=2917812 RepID=A0AAE3K812_9EURY|nr:ribose-phosphate diphosphokinase [Natronocalculus amylovorans]MCL9816025.1 ribose-phosphate diphosphokinase [Natronocalculus amylovorans]